MTKDISTLLKGRKCSCGMNHTCDIENVIITSGAINELGNLVKSYKKILVAADENTYKACGEAVTNQLEGKAESILIYESRGVLVPNEEAIKKLMKATTNKTDLIIGIGSGVIQDLCKYVSSALKFPYFIVATAPSMDGYASQGAAMIIDNMKVTYNAAVPKAIIADTEVLKNAPLDMIKSGYGDIIGKHSCLNDWKLSRVINGEYFCECVYDLTYETTERVSKLGAALLKREPEAIRQLMEALVITGIAMAYVGNSRPASGSEHHMSHFFEVTGIINNEKYFMHGTDVAYSAVYTQALREEIISLEELKSNAVFDNDRYMRKIKDIYGKAADGVISLQQSVGRYNVDYSSVYKEKQREIKETLKEAPSKAHMIKLLKNIGLETDEFERLYGKDKIQNAVWFAKDLKDRYSVLWLYYDLFYNSGR